MFSKNRPVSIVAALLVLAFSLTLAAVSAADADHDPNIRITFTLGKIEGNGRAEHGSFALVVSSGGPKASLLTGARVPIPTKSTDVDADDDPEISYSYQNVGLQANVQALILISGRIQMQSFVENSWVDPETPGSQPVVQTRHQEATVILEDGKPLEIARSTDGDVVRYVEVQADILD